MVDSDQCERGHLRAPLGELHKEVVLIVRLIGIMVEGAAHRRHVVCVDLLKGGILILVDLGVTVVVLEDADAVTRAPRVAVAVECAGRLCLAAFRRGNEGPLVKARWRLSNRMQAQRIVAGVAVGAVVAGAAGRGGGRGRLDGAAGREGAAREGNLADVQVPRLGRLAPCAEAVENVHCGCCVPWKVCLEKHGKELVYIQYIYRATWRVAGVSADQSAKRGASQSDGDDDVGVL